MTATLLTTITAISTLLALLAAIIMYFQARTILLKQRHIQARTILLKQRHIHALERRVEVVEQAAALSRQRATVLEGSIEIQQTHLDLLVEQNGELEDRNAYLERVLRSKFLLYVLGLPPMEGPLVMGEKGRMGPVSRN